MNDKRIYLPDGNRKKLADRLSMSGSSIDVCLKGFGGMNPDTYKKVREEAKKSFEGQYLFEFNGNRLFISCQLVEALEGANKLQDNILLEACLKYIVRKLRTNESRARV